MMTVESTHDFTYAINNKITRAFVSPSQMNHPVRHVGSKKVLPQVTCILCKIDFSVESMSGLLWGEPNPTLKPLQNVVSLLESRYLRMHKKTACPNA